ncbi:putative metalloprotease [Hoeflea phototrophica DFL-43]|jgi:predicted metalloprotease|uniref:Putative metalloprotease n=1 Tax=Hoeflea phototrophica (strain DSM 17068 / NCIMB 14078 / DFL-43) TaxID=411684 RepID=A9DE97_HOEPD|nr:neutral zinc metallopeptidase [Hoeflea phototrophica]EDQ31993.1 putative metalloprotease [Hoeflea phototrophica DFL-43]
MDWKGRRQSDNIEDRRGSRSRGGNPFGRGGMRLPSGGIRRSGLSFKTILIIGVVYLVLKLVGIDPLQLLGGDPGAILTGQPSAPANQISPARQDEMTQFVATVLAETEDVWNGIMQSQGFDYPEPTLVLFSGAVASACGNASSASGPFYCPGDQKVYIDLSFFDELAQRFKASGDFAQAYVIAHEVGHHVQNLIGVLPRFNQMRRSMSQAEQNQMSIRVELQADCFAGIWGHYTAQKGLLERGDLEEALNAAQQIGDDTIQRRTQGYIVPESFSHGTAAQRKTWFARGFDSGRLEACDTFNNPV